MKRARSSVSRAGCTRSSTLEEPAPIMRAAGLFRHHNESPKVGDDVTYDDDLIRTILPRRNNLARAGDRQRRPGARS
ncbi:MAG: hypothetical protein MZU97_09660 [Bacillus subtilis]|nr:hypothetical protein [Bacillus subtilis]